MKKVLKCLIFISFVLFFNTGNELKSELIENFKVKENQKAVSKVNMDLAKSVISKWENRELNLKNVWQAMIDLRITYPEIVFNQLIIESGTLTSNLCKRNNNLFGMKFPNKRFSWAVKKTKQNNSFYSSWIYSVLDILEYQITRKTKDYKKHLINSKYAKSTSYGKRMASMDLTKRYDLDLDYVSDIPLIKNELLKHFVDSLNKIIKKENEI